MLRDWIALARKDERVRAIVGGLRDGGATPIVRVGGVYGSAQALLVAALQSQPAGGAPVVVVALGVEEADDILADLASFGAENVLRFPAWEALPEQDTLPNF